VVPYGLVVDVDPDHRIGAQLGRLLLHLGQRIADPGSEFVLVGLGPAAEDIAHAGAHVLECVHAEYALSGDDSKVFGHGTALDPGGGRDEHVRSSLLSSANVRFPDVLPARAWMPPAQITQSGLSAIARRRLAPREIGGYGRQTKPTTQRDVTGMLDVVAAPEVCRLGPRTVAYRHCGLNAVIRLWARCRRFSHHP